MNKADLISAVAAQANLTKVDARKALDAIIAVTGDTLKKGDKLTLVGFGTFSVNNRSERTSRNPRTEGKIKIAAKKIVRFKAGAELTKKVK